MNPSAFTAALKQHSQARSTHTPKHLIAQAERNLCTCGAVEHGTPHLDWCDWQLAEWRLWRGEPEHVPYAWPRGHVFGPEMAP